MEYHKTKDGKKIKISDLDTKHLINIIEYIKRKAKLGLVIRIGGGFDANDMWYDAYVIHGKRVKIYLNYKTYKRELKRREIKN